MKYKAIVVITIVTVIAASSAAIARIKYAGGDGSSMAKRIIILGAHGEADGVRSEYDWLRKFRPSCQRGGQSLAKSGSHFIDILDIRCNGRQQSVYFDITRFFGKI